MVKISNDSGANGRRRRANKLERIRERAGELAMNHGKRAEEADEAEMRRAQRELLDMEITSPDSASAP